MDFVEAGFVGRAVASRAWRPRHTSYFNVKVVGNNAIAARWSIDAYAASLKVVGHAVTVYRRLYSAWRNNRHLRQQRKGLPSHT